VLIGYWSELKSDRECTTERLGSRHWGRIRWTFSDGAFTGTYGYCEDEGKEDGEGSTDLVSGAYRSRWDQIAGPGMPWTTGWVPNVHAPVCITQNILPGSLSRCQCGDQNYCGEFPNGAVIIHWQKGCDQPPITLRCTSEPQDVVDGYIKNVTGVWDTNDSVITLQEEGGTVRGTYTLDEGRLEGSLQGNVVSGYWGEAASDRACDSERLGTKYWGRFRFTFSGDAFTGLWGYCEDEREGRWDGKRRPG
jgi:hypothetical protein